MSTCLNAYMPTCLHAYMPTCLHGFTKILTGTTLIDILADNINCITVKVFVVRHLVILVATLMSLCLYGLNPPLQTRTCTGAMLSRMWSRWQALMAKIARYYGKASVHLTNSTSPYIVDSSTGPTRHKRDSSGIMIPVVNIVKNNYMSHIN